MFPDLSKLQSRVAELVSKQWEKWYKTSTNVPVHPIKEVEIRMVRRADNLLTNIPVHREKAHNSLKDSPVYLVHAVAQSGFWKTTTEHVLVLQNLSNTWRLLLHFSGGWNGNGIDFEIIDLGTSSRQEAVLIHDYACGNQMSQTRTHIYRYDKEENRFAEIFNQLTTWLPSAIPTVYKSVVSFEESKSVLKKIVIQTELVKQHPVHMKVKPRRRSVFKWDGKKYVGKLDVPITVE
ncbi:MAG: hypothetical protein ACYSUD_04910 [Planctomycetota bacterium]